MTSMRHEVAWPMGDVAHTSLVLLIKRKKEKKLNQALESSAAQKHGNSLERLIGVLPSVGGVLLFWHLFVIAERVSCQTLLVFVSF